MGNCQKCFLTYCAFNIMTKVFLKLMNFVVEANC